MSEQATALHLQVPVSDMHCASCVKRVEKALNSVPGVQQASVNLASEKADVTLAEGTSASALQQAVTDAGFGVRTEMFRVAVSGMHCASCVSHIEKALNLLPGVISVSVNLASEQAQVEALAGNLDMPQLLQAVKDAGYEAAPLTSEREDDNERRGKNNAS